MYMFAFIGNPTYRSITPINTPTLHYAPSVSFRLTSIRSTRPKGMFIDMNAGKGCHSCGNK